MGQSNEQALNYALRQWAKELTQKGLTRATPTSALDPFSIISSGFGHRVVKGAHREGGPPPTLDHEALDTTVLTAMHLKKYPALQAELNAITEAFPGLKQPLEQQLKHYPGPDSIGRVPVKAVIAGRVLHAGKWNEASGQTVIIGGDNGKIYSYAHLAPGSYAVEKGDYVKQGQALATIGRSGTTNGICVHVVERELPFPGHAGEKPNFDRWSYLHKQGNRITGRDFSAALHAAMGEDWPTRLTVRDFDRVPGTFMFHDNPREGTPIRPNRNDYITAATVAKLRQTAGPATPASKEHVDSWGEWIAHGVGYLLPDSIRPDWMTHPAPKTPPVAAGPKGRQH